ncbi:MAG: SDR family NAD(P)-dependent oxidoreductase [Candidatus Acidiferrales bacterium]
MANRPLTGKVALVTGAARRIGRSIALRLAQDGADVVVNYRHSNDDAERVAAEIRAFGRRALVVQADVSVPEEVRAMFSTLDRGFKRLDILVNNAGVFFAAPFQQLTVQQWDAAMNSNLKSQFLCSQAAAPLLKRNPPGRIINLSSLGGMLAWPSFTHYCVSKAGSIMLTRCLARALAPDILVNSIAPGTIQFEGEEPDEDYIRRTPLKRTGAGDDIAGAVAYLATADYVTGQVIAVDGGRALT